MSAVVWITRTNGEATADAVKALGHEAVLAPVLAVQPIAADINALRFDALILTSRNGASAFAQMLNRRDLPVWCVGDATAEAARHLGFNKVTSAGGDAHALFETLKAEAPRGLHYLYAAPSAPSAPLAAWLGAEGFAVSQVAVYETCVITPVISPDDLGRITHILIHSARAGQALADWLSVHGKLAFTNSCFICISEKAWQGFANAIETQDARLLEGVRVRISPFPDDASMLRLIDGDAV